MLQLHTKMWKKKHHKNESFHPDLIQWDKTISEVKLTVKFYSL